MELQNGGGYIVALYIQSQGAIESGRWKYGITLKQYVFSEIDSNTGYIYIVSIYNEAFQDSNKMRLMYDNFASRVRLCVQR